MMFATVSSTIYERSRVSSRDLGIKPYQANKIKNRKRRVTDNLLKRMLELLASEKYTELVKGCYNY